MHIVRIEFQRVQSFLFAVPRLSEMVGANVLMGETLRETGRDIQLRVFCR